MNDLQRFVKDRDEMLMKCSIEELRKFVGEHKNYLNPIVVDATAKADDKVLEITLHKMIVNCTNLPFEFRQKSADWLLDNGYSLDIYGGTEND